MKGKILAIVIGGFLIGTVVLTVALTGERTGFQNKALVGEAKLSLAPATGTLPATVKLFLDPSGSNVVFVKAVVMFNKDQLSLSSAPTLSSKFANVVKISTPAEANASGVIEIIGGVNPPATPLNAPAEIASLSFAAKTSSVQPTSNNVSISVSQSQVVSLPETVMTILGSGSKLSTSETPTITPPTAPSLSFGLKLQGIGNSGVARPVTLFVGSTPFPVTLISNSSGVFSPSSPVALSGITPGTYDIFVKDNAHLKKKLGSMQIVAGANTAPTSFNAVILKAGDFDDNNVLNLIDVSRILSKYTAITVPVNSSNALYDVDQNGQINLTDISHVLSNYTKLTVPGE